MRMAFAMAALALLAAPAQAAPITDGRVQFDVLRNGEPFGRHEVTVTRNGESQEVRAQVRLAVRFGPVTVFRYEHDCREQWTGEALVALTCSTLKDGRRSQVTARREADALVVQGAQGLARFAATAAPTSWPTSAQVEGGSYIDTETGAARTIRVTRVGRETITVAGRTIEADRFRIASSLTMDAWYDSEGRWVKAAFTARGQQIEYRLTSPLTAAPRPA